MLALLLAAGPAAGGEPQVLVLYANHRPPLYVLHPPESLGGAVLSRAMQVLRLAGVPFRIEEVPSRRALSLLEGPRFACGVGWFKLPQREKAYRFSQPLFNSGPLEVLIGRQWARDLPARLSLEALVSGPLILGTVSGYSYGAWADALIARHRPPMETAIPDVAHLAKMLQAGRCHYSLLNASEAEWLLEHDPLLARDLEVRPLEGAPAGELRYLMCSRLVSPEVMERIDQAIAELDARDPAGASAHPGR